MTAPFTGEVKMFGGPFSPVHWAMCTGQTVATNQFSELFALIGTAFGGDGRTSFTLPDMRGRIPVGQGTGPGLAPKAVGQSLGTEVDILSLSQLPYHSHVFTADSNDAVSDSGENQVFGSLTTNDAIYVNTFDKANAELMSKEAIADTGRGIAHSNIMPSTCLNFIICLTGIFPSRN